MTKGITNQPEQRTIPLIKNEKIDCFALHNEKMCNFAAQNGSGCSAAR